MRLRIDRLGLGSQGGAASITVLLALACLGSAIVLGASEFMTTFELTPPGGEALDASQGGDRHAYAMLLLAAFSIVALAVALTTGSKPAAIAVAATGGIALLVFLVADLPDAGRIGTLDDPRQSFIDAEAVPQSGFWLELVGALGLALAGAALATLRPEQLRLFEPGGDAREPANAPAEPERPVSVERRRTPSGERLEHEARRRTAARRRRG